jgi:hypothetical protein
MIAMNAHTAYVVQASSPEHAMALVRAGHGVPVVFGGAYGAHLSGARTKQRPDHMGAAGRKGGWMGGDHMAATAYAMPSIIGPGYGARAVMQSHMAGGDHAGQSLFCPSGCWDGWWIVGLTALGFAVGGFLGWQMANAMQLGTAAGKALPALLPALGV